MGLSNDSPAAAFLLVSLATVVLTQGLAYAAQPWPSATQPSTLSLAAALCMAIQWVAFVPAALWNTEKFFDLTGSLTYVGVTLFTLFMRQGGLAAMSVRQIVASALVVVWAARLGLFLFWRISRDGKDGRFDEIKKRPLRFLNVWCIQGAWTFLTAMAVFTLNAIPHDGTPIGVVDYVGAALWALGFAVECIADAQKTAFKAKPRSKGRWIDEGLWSCSRHPNYAGEITLWIGAFVLCCHAFPRAAMWVSSISPIFVTFLLTRVSGIPMLEARANARWGTDREYQRYRLRTSVLLLLPRFYVSDEAVDAAVADAERRSAISALQGAKGGPVEKQQREQPEI